MKAIAIPDIDKGGRRFDRDNLALLERVRQLPPGIALEVDIPGAADKEQAHIFRTNKRQALARLGLRCKTRMISLRKFAIWPEETVESL